MKAFRGACSLGRVQVLARKEEYRSEQGGLGSRLGQEELSGTARPQSSPQAVLGMVGGLGAPEEMFGCGLVSRPE